MNNENKTALVGILTLGCTLIPSLYFGLETNNFPLYISGLIVSIFGTIFLCAFLESYLDSKITRNERPNLREDKQ